MRESVISYPPEGDSPKGCMAREFHGRAHEGKRKLIDRVHPNYKPQRSYQWPTNTFNKRLEAAVAGTPFSVEMLAVTAQQETVLACDCKLRCRHVRFAVKINFFRECPSMTD